MKDLSSRIDELEKRVETLEKILKISEGLGEPNSYKDELFDEVVKYVATIGIVSPSAIQRRFNIGYNRAARIADQLEQDGICAPVVGTRSRRVNIEVVRALGYRV